MDVILSWHLLLIVAFVLVKTEGHTSIASGNHIIKEYDNTNITQDASNDVRLMETKFCLAAALFLAVLIACGLPIVVINYLQRNTTNHQTQPPFYYHSYAVTKVEQSFPRHEVVVGSDGNEAVDSPMSMSITPIGENIDLLTGQSVRGNPDRRRPRQTVGAFGDLRASGDGIPHSSCPLQTPTTTQHSQCHGSRGHEVRKPSLGIWFSRCNCFAAGIFLSSGFMDLYPDVEEAIANVKRRLLIEKESPLAPFLILLGFFLVLSVEQIVLTVKVSRTARLHREGQQINRSHLQHTIDGAGVSTPSVKSFPQNCGSHMDDEQSSLRNQTMDTELDCHELVSPAVDLSSPLACTGPPSPTMYTPDSHTPMIRNSASVEHNIGHNHTHLEGLVSEISSFTSLLRVILLLCAMSLHSLFEGLAVGLQTTVQKAVSLFTAILLHKIIIAVGIGFNLAILVGGKRDSSRETTALRSKNGLLQQLCGTLIFAFSSPVGVLCGLSLLTLQSSNGLILTIGILQGFACGTFFYVVFCELLPEEFREGSTDRIVKLLFLILGFLVIAGYSFFMSM